jgi:hypothetical protein
LYVSLKFCKTISLISPTCQQRVSLHAKFLFNPYSNLFYEPTFQKIKGKEFIMINYCDTNDHF